jgi:hypothetical protein
MLRTRGSTLALNRSGTNMQKHEGPRRDHDAEERDKQRVVTIWLLIAILLLGGLLAVVLFTRM